jgi:transposase InsO family protein/transposase-like protein
MPWRTKSVEELRKQFLLHIKENDNISLACREFGITRRTGYKWLRRAESGRGLSDLSRRPNRIANKSTPEIEELVLDVRENNKSWGGRMIRDHLILKGNKGLPSARTLCNILKRSGCIEPSESLKHRAFVRFAREHCNELWQTDFKGDFQILDRSRCYPLTILDDCSRYSLIIDCKLSTRGVRDTFEKAFIQYGLPDAVLSDNGSQFAGFRGGYTGFERWLMEHDVLPIHGRAYHPQTQGKIERFHRTMKYEFLKYHQFKDIEELRKRMEEWRIKYNEERPHLALNSKTPADVYSYSKRKYSEIVPEYLYDGRVVKVNNWGVIRFSKWQIYLSETMANTLVEITESSTGDGFNVYFRNYKIAVIDPQEGSLKNRKIYRCRE